MIDSTVAADPASLLFVWGQFGPYHHDRCAAAARLPGRSVVGLEVASGSEHHYAWESAEAVGFTKRTLFPGKTYEQTGRLRRLAALLREAIRAGARHNFLCHYEKPEIFVLAIVLRLLRRRVFVMWESKFDDRPRDVWREVLKWLLLRPYHGALTSGIRARGYLAFLGMAGRPIADGYDSVSVDRVRRDANAQGGPDGTPFVARSFVVVARLVEKKNLPLALAAYDLYRRRVGTQARRLIFIGSGPLREALAAEVKIRALDGVHFAGFLQAPDVAREMAQSLALVLPSNEEQWGLVVNEALALGIPVLCSENVGARDFLVRDGCNGHVFAPHDVERLARLMDELASHEVRWRAMSEAAWRGADAGDADRFADGVRALIEAVP